MQRNDLDMPFKSWKKTHLPKRILVIRLQAMGDLVITLPYLQHLRNALPPDTRIDLLTRKEVDPIPKALILFDRIYSLGGKRNWKKQFLHAMIMLPKLFMKRYDVVIDLQNNIVSNTVRKFLLPSAWSEFDRYTPLPAGECTRLAIEAIGLGKCLADSHFKIKFSKKAIDDLLLKNGWNGRSKLIILNPAGAFENRHWPLPNYVDFAKRWLKKYPDTQFVITGLNTIASKADHLQEHLGHYLVNLVNRSSAVEAFALVRHVQLVVSEDSGLMHMAWISGTPTLALFGSSNSYRATPLGEHSLLLSSSDLSCGNCLLETCLHGDNRCLTRYSPEFVFEKAVSLLHSVESKISLNV